MYFSLLRRTRTVNFMWFSSASQRAIPSFFQFTTSGVAKVLKDLKEVLGEPESRSTNLADKLTHVGRRGNNYSPSGWVGGEGKREFVSPAPHHHPASQGNLQT